MKNILFACLLICISCGNSIGDAALPDGIRVRVLTDQLHYPWDMVWGPDGRIWVTQRDGNISRVDTGSGKLTSLITIDEVLAQGEGGLLGMALHPNWKIHPYVFVAYDYRKNGNYTAKVVRYTFNRNTLIQPQTIIDNIQAAGIHNGCRLLCSADEKLFITTGDASDQSLPQNTAAVNGKILRINMDGSIPVDNPFPGSPVWSKGHRNPQGLVWVDNRLFSSEHGPDSDDEINIIEKGGNYGWPAVKGYCNEAEEKKFCDAAHVKEPIKAWTPTLAVSGMDYYAGTRIPGWNNSLLLATLKNSSLLQLKLNDAHTAIVGSNVFLRNEYGRLRDVCSSPDGKVYVCSSNGSGDKIIVLWR